ncbi:hypothetical protein BDF20DRAFT_857273 [Mycotypha africana]|uniref:uncharacterized protein n=1 Tax=Mycotypha africana TaxID=64632 RepID=UPI002300F38E|nr:uncharacterized protein BDF20DRAFT_857273 [Mycotypha africana]KAI8983973.1 hypothetical protein BDF20DRAFT_857273 [Mycotypha africana]
MASSTSFLRSARRCLAGIKAFFVCGEAFFLLLVSALGDLEGIVIGLATVSVNESLSSACFFFSSLLFDFFLLSRRFGFRCWFLAGDATFAPFSEEPEQELSLTFEEAADGLLFNLLDALFADVTAVLFESNGDDFKDIFQMSSLRNVIKINNAW